jgi:hypothetical protein
VGGVDGGGRGLLRGFSVQIAPKSSCFAAKVELRIFAKVF